MGLGLAVRGVDFETVLGATGIEKESVNWSDNTET